MITPPGAPGNAHPDWRLIEPPPELWPMVVASTIERARLRRQVLRSLRVPLAIAAIMLIIASSGATVWFMRRLPALSRDGSAPTTSSSRTNVPRAPHAPAAPRP